MAGPGCWSRDQLLSLNLDAFLSLYKENEFPLELGRHLSLDQVNHQGLTQSLIKSDTASGLICYGDDSVSHCSVVKIAMFAVRGPHTRRSRRLEEGVQRPHVSGQVSNTEEAQFKTPSAA